MGKLDGNVALITGAGSGIGRASAILFAQEGAKVAVADYVPAGGQETVKMIKDSGGEAVFIEADVSKTADVQRMVNATVEAYGRIDILFNNAGINGPLVRTAEASEEDWDRIININLKGVFLASKYSIPVMLSGGGGAIVNTASIAGFMASPYDAAYSASKGGVIQLTKSIALEYAHQNIRVNCICPGVIETPMAEMEILPERASYIPQKRKGQPDDIARAALYLACEDSSYVTATSLVVDGGWTAQVTVPLKGKR